MPAVASSIAQRRKSTSVAVVSGSLDILYAEPQALERLGISNGTHIDTPMVRDAILETIRALEGDECRSVRVGTIFLHVCRLHSPAGHDASYALLVEQTRRREDLTTAKRRFLLTPREVQVLRETLDGNDAGAIANALGIAESTVRAYFRALLAKTDARNRAHMLAKVFGYDHDRHEGEAQAG